MSVHLSSPHGEIGELSRGWQVTIPSSSIEVASKSVPGGASFSAKVDERCKYLTNSHLLFSLKSSTGIHIIDNLSLAVSDIRLSNITAKPSRGSNLVEQFYGDLYPSLDLFPSDDLFPEAIPHTKTEPIPGYDAFADLSTLTAAGKLSSNVTAPSSPSGYLERRIKLPRGITYEIDGTEYVTGGNPTIYDASGGDYAPLVLTDGSSRWVRNLYVLASGSHDGEVVYVFDLTGNFSHIFPVYSDSTDLSTPESRTILAMVGNEDFGDDNLQSAVLREYVIVGQNAACRIKYFYGDNGEFVSQFGTNGGGEGEFENITSTCLSMRTNSLFVADRGLGRVQEFSKWGVYVSQFGTTDPAPPGMSFYNMSGISYDDIARQLYVADEGGGTGRVRAYRKGGLVWVYLGLAFGGDNPTFREGSNICIQVDPQGNVFTRQDNILYKFVISSPRIWTDTIPRSSLALGDNFPAKTWIIAAQDWTYLGIDCDGFLYLGEDQSAVSSYCSVTNSVRSYLRFYVSLASPDIPITIEESLNELDYKPSYIAWDGNLLDEISNLLAVTNNRLSVSGSRIVFSGGQRNVINEILGVLGDINISLVNTTSVNSIEYIAQNSYYTDGAEEFYNSISDNRVISVDVGEVVRVNIKVDGAPERVYRARLGTYRDGPVDPGEYQVVDDEGEFMAAFENYGGGVTALTNNRPNEITLVVTGPRQIIPSTTPPYKISTVAGLPALSIVGVGVKSSPVTRNIGLGNYEYDTSLNTVKSLDSPFMDTPDVADSAAVLVAYSESNPVATLSAWCNYEDVLLDPLSLVGHLYRFDDSDYVIDSANIRGDGKLNISMHKFSMCGRPDYELVGPRRFEEFWEDKTQEEFESLWARQDSSAFEVAPYRLNS